MVCLGKFLDEYGLARAWYNIKNYVDVKAGGIISGGATVDYVNEAIDSSVGDINSVLDAINGEVV